MADILFFGYGANRDRSKISQIIGHDPGEPVGAILEGYNLYIQTLSQLPISIQPLLGQIYGDNFKAYTLKPAKGIVSGLIWTLNDKDLEKFKEWEFVDIWREIIEVDAKSEEGHIVTVLTEKSQDRFPTSYRIDGISYQELGISKKPSKQTVQKDQYFEKKQIKLIENWLKTQPDT